VIRQFDSSVERVRESTAIVRQGVVGSRELKRIVAETKIQLEQMEKACSHSALNDKDKSELQKKLRNAISGWEKAPASQREHKAFSRIGAKDKEIIERVFALVYACSPNKQSAKTLIDQILRRL
jgi:Holliday junction resolvasome RuvABC DNA-binding subunit